MSYRVSFDPRAEEDLAKITRTDKNLAQRIMSKIKFIGENSHSIDHASLKGGWGGFYKYRIGDYRIIYGVDENNKAIEICYIGHRKNVYKQ